MEQILSLLCSTTADEAAKVSTLLYIHGHNMLVYVLYM